MTIKTPFGDIAGHPLFDSQPYKEPRTTTMDHKTPFQEWYEIFGHHNAVNRDSYAAMEAAWDASAQRCLMHVEKNMTLIQPPTTASQSAPFREPVQAPFKTPGILALLMRPLLPGTPPQQWVIEYHRKNQDCNPHIAMAMEIERLTGVNIGLMPWLNDAPRMTVEEVDGHWRDTLKAAGFTRYERRWARHASHVTFTLER